MNKKS